jgi:hypothetical protein
MKDQQQQNIVVCRAIQSTDELAYLIPGSIVVECSKCESLMAIAPNGKRFADEHKAILLCDECAMDIPQDDFDLQGTVPGALEELHAHGFYTEITTADELVSELVRRRWGG